MTNAMATTISRRGWLSRLLMAAAVAPMMGATRADSVVAGKKKKKKKIASVADRTEDQRLGCENAGGKLAVLDGPDGGNTTECKGGENDGFTCTNPKDKLGRCWYPLTNPQTKPGGGGAVPPTGGTEDPTSGGNNAGGGNHVPPSGGVGPTGGGSDPVLE